MLAVITITIFLLSTSDAFHFNLKSGDKKCFIRELPDNTLLIAHYRCKFLDQNVSYLNEMAVMMIEVKDVHKHIILSKEYRDQGRFTFRSHVPGEHEICMRPKTLRNYGKTLRIDLGLQTGEHTINYTAIATKEHLTDLQTKYLQLLEKAKEVSKEMDYQRYREEIFRESTETLSRRVLLWSVGQTIILILMGIWQVEQLRQFFNSKKLM